jgi:DNA-binding transcriptional ArsR family regulator
VTAPPITSVDLARVYKALGDPTRLAIFEIVRNAPESRQGLEPAEIDHSISQIAAGFDLSLSTVSHHIKELRAAGLLVCKRRGQRIYCSTNPELVEQAGAFLARR